MRIQARHYSTGRAIELTCEAGKIASVGPHGNEPPDMVAGWVAPALFDLQINGCQGVSFNGDKLTAEDIHRVVATCRQHGIGSFFPTLVTNSLTALDHGFRTLRQACETSPAIARAVLGFHLEGPYISSEDGPRGAHPREHVRRPDWAEFCRLQDAAGGRIRLVTLAPEQDGALPFIEKLSEAGVVVALGHTAASGRQIRDAVGAGARLSTHLGNGCNAMLPRHDNCIWEQLADDGLWASVITDGHHLPAAVVRCIVRVKTPRRTILTCDASSLAGRPPGTYSEWGQQFEVLPEGKIVVSGTSYLAGSWAFTDQCIGNAIRFAGITLGEAVEMAGARPRELLGLPPRTLEPGMPAELVLFDWEEGGDFRVKTVVV